MQNLTQESTVVLLLGLMQFNGWEIRSVVTKHHLFLQFMSSVHHQWSCSTCTKFGSTRPNICLVIVFTPDVTDVRGRSTCKTISSYSIGDMRLYHLVISLVHVLHLNVIQGQSS